MTNVYVVLYNERDSYDGWDTSVAKVFYVKEDAKNYCNERKETRNTFYDWEEVHIE